MTLQTQIQKKVDFLSAAEKRLAQYILNDNTAAVLTTTGDLARAVGISESTVVRFAQSLGFKGFPEMKRAGAKGPAHALARSIPDGRNNCQHR